MNTEVDVGTRQRLVEAAEPLFAEQGVEGPSLAAITQAAGLANTGAVHYHFGGRQGLLDAIIEEHRVDLDRRRDELLDELEALGDTGRGFVVRALVEPMVAKLDDPRGRAFLAIQAQTALRPRPRRAEPRPLAGRMYRMLGGDRVADDLRVLLGEFGRDLAYAALAHRAVVESVGGRDAGLGREEFVRQLVAAVARAVGVA